MRGGLHSALAQGVSLLTTVASIPLLTRLLEPADFGLVAMVTVFTGLAVMFVDAGLAMATVQRETISHQQVSNLFWIAATLGLVVALCVCAASPVVAWFYGDARLVPITLALAAAPFFSGLAIQHQALLRREMRLGRLAAVQVGSAVLAHTVVIIAAWHYRSYWALVLLPVAMAAFRSIGTWVACGWCPSLPRRTEGVRSMVGFGANLTGFNFVNYFSRSGDNMLIGWSWGEAALGLYERAYKLMMAPLQQINGPLAGVMVPALSRLVAETETYKTTYFRAIAIVQLISCPLMVFLAIAAPSVVRVMFGAGYDEAVPVLRWLAIAGFMQPLMNSLGWLYISQGRARELLRWGLVSGLLIVMSFVLGLPHGPVGVARAYALTICIVVVPLAIWFAGSSGPVTRSELGKACGAAVLMSMPTGLASTVALHMLEIVSATIELAVALIASAIATAPALRFTKMGRTLWADLMAISRIGFPGARESEVSSSQASLRSDDRGRAR